MVDGETHLQLEEGHVAERLVRLVRQRALVASLELESIAFRQAAQWFLVEVEAFHLQAVAQLAIERARSIPLPI